MNASNTIESSAQGDIDGGIHTHSLCLSSEATLNGILVTTPLGTDPETKYCGEMNEKSNPPVDTSHQGPPFLCDTCRRTFPAQENTRKTSEKCSSKGSLTMPNLPPDIHAQGHLSSPRSGETPWAAATELLQEAAERGMLSASLSSIYTSMQTRTNAC